MKKSNISGWVRQARFRAKNHNIYSDLKILDILDTIDQLNSKCEYCSELAETLDHIFPLRDHAPNVSANVLPVCRKCKTAKKNNSIIWMYEHDLVSKNKYLEILNLAFNRHGGDVLKSYVRKISGI